MAINNINQYEDITYLQRGGTSYILKVKNKYNDQYCAIKLSIDSKKETCIYNEGKILKKTNHKNIIRLLNVNKLYDKLYLVLELLEGQTLQDFIDHNGPLSYHETLDIFKQICTGVSYLHSIDIIHKDLKPRNIFLCNNGDVKILDFGLAEVKNNHRNIKAQNNIRGTIDFISPQQILNSNIVEKWSDTYSLGAILYFLNTGKTMFQDKLLNNKIRKKIFGYYPIQNVTNPDIKELIQFTMFLYENKSENIQEILDQIHIKQIIHKWNLC
jgi:serine/threonine-protein kinase